MPQAPTTAPFQEPFFCTPLPPPAPRSPARPPPGLPAPPAMPPPAGPARPPAGQHGPPPVGKGAGRRARPTCPARHATTGRAGWPACQPTRPANTAHRRQERGQAAAGRHCYRSSSTDNGHFFCGGGLMGWFGCGLEVGCGGFVRLALAFILYLCNFARQARRVQVNVPAPA